MVGSATIRLQTRRACSVDLDSGEWPQGLKFRALGLKFRAKTDGEWNAKWEVTRRKKWTLGVHSGL